MTALVLGRAYVEQKTLIKDGKADVKPRRCNTLGAFSVPRTYRVSNKRVILIDDVASSGATLAAAASALLVGGAAAIFPLVIQCARNRTRLVLNPNYC